MVTEETVALILLYYNWCGQMQSEMPQKAKGASRSLQQPEDAGIPVGALLASRSLNQINTQNRCKDELWKTTCSTIQYHTHHTVFIV